MYQEIYTNLGRRFLVMCDTWNDFEPMRYIKNLKSNETRSKLNQPRSIIPFQVYSEFF